MFNIILAWFANRLREPSTYFGIVSAVLGGLGVAYDNGTVQSIAGALAVLVGAALAIYREKSSPDRSQPDRAAQPPAAPTPATGDHDRGKLPDDAMPERPHPPIGDARDIWRNRRRDG